MKVLLNGFHLNGHTLGFEPDALKLEPPCTTYYIINSTTWKYWSVAFIWMVTHTKDNEGQRRVKNEFIFYLQISQLSWSVQHARWSVSELVRVKYLMPTWNSKWKYENLASLVHVFRNTAELSHLNKLLFCRGRQRNVQRFLLYGYNSTRALIGCWAGIIFL